MFGERLILSKTVINILTGSHKKSDSPKLQGKKRTHEQWHVNCFRYLFFEAKQLFSVDSRKKA